MSTQLSEAEEGGFDNPLYHLEMIISENEWPYEKVGEDEITASIPCQWGEYCLRAVWIEEESVLHLAATTEIQVAPEQQHAVLDAINLINERLPLGHFVIWTDEMTIMCRHSHLLLGDAFFDNAGLERIISILLGECERFLPAFQFVMHSGKDPKEAIDLVMMETIGEA